MNLTKMSLLAKIISLKTFVSRYADRYLFPFLIVMIFLPLLYRDGEQSANVNSRNNGNGTAKLTWDAPKQKTDGMSLTNLGGYKIYSSGLSHRYTLLLTLPLASNPSLCKKTNSHGNVQDRVECTYTVQGLGKGPHYFAVTAYDTFGQESDFSNEVSKQFK